MASGRLLSLLVPANAPRYPSGLYTAAAHACQGLLRAVWPRHNGLLTCWLSPVVTGTTACVCACVCVSAQHTNWRQRTAASQACATWPCTKNTAAVAGSEKAGLRCAPHTRVHMQPWPCCTGGHSTAKVAALLGILPRPPGQHGRPHMGGALKPPTPPNRMAVTKDSHIPPHISERTAARLVTCWARL